MERFATFFFGCKKINIEGGMDGWDFGWMGGKEKNKEKQE